MIVSKRFIEIVRILQGYDSYCPASQLANRLSVSTKTVLRAITNQDGYKERFGFEVTSKTGYGHKLSITDQDKFAEFQKEYLEGENLKVLEKDQREREIIKILLQQEGFITISQIAEEIYVSETTVSLSLKSVRAKLQKYDVQLVHKTAHGVRLEGNEMSIRLCYAKFVMGDQTKSTELTDYFKFEEDDIEKVNTIILDTLMIYQIEMSDLSRKHLVLHILISIYRMNHHKFISFDEQEVMSISSSREYIIAESIVKKLKDMFVIEDLTEEVMYIAVQLLGKRSLSGKSKQYQMAKDIEAILNDIFHEINHQFEIDLTEDVEVFNYLAMHFEPMLARLRYGIKSNNPLVEEVKSQKPMPFEMGLIAKQIVIKNWGYELDDDEVGYLAMYFSLALDKLKYIKKPKNILVVCGLGVCSSRILLYKLRQQYGDYIDEILTCQLHELKDISTKYFDCVISTVRQPIATDLPVIYVDDFLNGLNEKELDAFFLEQSRMFQIEKYLQKDLFFHVDSLESEEEVIDFMLEEIRKVREIPKELKDYIMERERLSSTALGRYCALPHPVKMCTDETIFAVLISQKAIKWKDKKVKAVFLLCPSKHQPGDLRYFNELLAQFIASDEIFMKFYNQPTFECLIEGLKEAEMSIG